MGNYMQSNTTLMFHLVSLTISWNILANISVYASLYRHTLFGYYVHAIISWVIIILTLTCTLSYIIPKGIPTHCSISQQDDCDYFQFPLAIEGSVLLVWIAVQVFSGILARILQENPLSKSLKVIRGRRFHQYSGWFILILGKVNCFIHWRAVMYIWIPLIVWEVVTISAYIQAKYFYKTLEATVVDPQTKKHLEYPKIKCIQELGSKKDYMIFADHVYQIWPLMTLHPAGYQIIAVTKGRQVDRFIYGMYTAEMLPEIPAYTHSEKSFELIGEPVARISIPSPYNSLYEINTCMISYKEVVSQKNQIFIIGLTAISGEKPFLFNGYTQLAQVGQYFSLTLDSKTTRLYTTVNCLAISNRSLMDSISILMKGTHKPNIREELENRKGTGRKQKSRLSQFPEIVLKKGASEVRLSAKYDTGASIEKLSDQIDELDSNYSSGGLPDAMVPMMIKKYDTGKLTPVLFSEQKEPDNIMISCPRGQGLKLQHLPTGNVIMVAGGTGFYPFMDLVDLLFKEIYLQNRLENTWIKQQIQALNPILKEKLIPNLTFEIYVAANGADDLHPISLYQLNYLCTHDSNRYKCVFKIKEGRQDFELKYPAIELTNERFDKLVIPEAEKQGTTKIYICGPPAMNTSMTQALLDRGVSQEMIELV